MKQFRTGVIGVGFIGAAHIEALRRLGNVTVAALCNKIDCERLAKQLQVPSVFDDYRKMIDSCDLDFVHICTPNNTHFEIASYALRHGVSVVCEKPLAVSVEEAEELTRLAGETGLINAVNFHSRCYPMVRHLKDLVGRGELGRLLSIHGEYLQDWLLYRSDYSWRLEQADGGSSRAVADIGSHWLDTAEYVSGQKITGILADFATFYPQRLRPRREVETFSQSSERECESFEVKTEDYAQILLNFDNGAKGSVVISQMFAGYKNKMVLSVAGTESSAVFDTEKLNELWLGRRDGYNMVAVKDPALLSAGARDLAAYPGGHIEGFPDAFKQHFRQIYRAAEEGAKMGDYATFADGAREMKLCDLIMRSAKEKKWMKME
ncbi:MAG: Gfo/Idh/MocA family oxidoreductase [Oscillospiraceae bacterium]|nr:Gfo/Idh/MocA family oxidoreductase [Oscillospiraceae bacterium]